MEVNMADEDALDRFCVRLLPLSLVYGALAAFLLSLTLILLVICVMLWLFAGAPSFVLFFPVPFAILAICLFPLWKYQIHN